jgi:hypothetical protein
VLKCAELSSNHWHVAGPWTSDRDTEGQEVRSRVRRSKAGAVTAARAESRDDFTPPSGVSLTSDLPDGAGRPGSRFAVRNRRVRTRLYAILLMPVLVGLVFGGFRVNDSIGTWDRAEDAQHTAELVRAAASYGNALLDERDRTSCGEQQPREPQLPHEPEQLASWSGSFAAQEPQAESGTGVHEGGPDRVGFHRPGPTPSSYRTTTGAGLPRREAGRSRQEGAPARQRQQHQPQPEPSEGRRDANDERWSRAGRLRDPQTSGLTASGLPRRAPRANLVAGTAEANPRGGPVVSRAPEGVRGRLSNLHRGVRRGRGAGDAPQNDRQGYGPGSTYDQER